MCWPINDVIKMHYDLQYHCENFVRCLVGIINYIVSYIFFCL